VEEEEEEEEGGEIAAAGGVGLGGDSRARLGIWRGGRERRRGALSVEVLCPLAWLRESKWTFHQFEIHIKYYDCSHF
jgi:hypothetical protein